MIFNRRDAEKSNNILVIFNFLLNKVLKKNLCLRASAVEIRVEDKNNYD